MLQIFFIIARQIFWEIRLLMQSCHCRISLHIFHGLQKQHRFRFAAGKYGRKGRLTQGLSDCRI